MAHRFPRATRDPSLADRDYIRNRAILRKQAAATQAPCSRCRKPIDYTATYWHTVRGKRTINRRAFVAGHKVARALGGTHDLSNLQPECAQCSITSGARLGRKLQGKPKRRTRVVSRPATATRW